MNAIPEIIAAAVAEVLPIAGDTHDAAQRAALDARGAARLAGLSEAEQEIAAQAAFVAVAGAPDAW